MMPVYFLSGLGADKRVYENIILPNEFEIRHIAWLEPFAEETLSEYTRRISQQIDLNRPFILIGMSLGGIIAIELNKIISPVKTIIFSTALTPKNYSTLFRFIRFFQLHNLIPALFFKIPSPPAYWIFGLENKRERYLLRSFMKNVSRHYLKWSIDKVINWTNEFKPSNLIQVHGTKDRIFPFKRSSAQIKIEKGGHFMVHNKSEQINSILKDILNQH